jgi:hypothetical protein
MSEDDLYPATILSEIFDMPVETVRNRLRGVPADGKRQNIKLYKLKTAAKRLVQPDDEDIERVLKSIRPTDLPPRLIDTFWAAKLKKQAYEENAKALWKSEDVEEAFGKIFIAFRNAVTLWAENVEREVGVTDGQREVLLKLSDDLMKIIHEQIMEMKEETDNAHTLDEDL